MTIEEQLKNFVVNTFCYRVDKELTRKEMSAKCGISEISLYKIETRRRNPSLKTAIKISSVVGKPLSEMVINPLEKNG